MRIVVTDKDVGRGVFYNDGRGNREFGKIKSFNDSWVFVVYNCADDWDNFKDYTAAATDRNDLEFAPEEVKEYTVELTGKETAALQDGDRVVIDSVIATILEQAK